MASAAGAESGLDGKLGEGVAVERRRLRERLEPELGLEHEQRPHRVDRGALGVGAAEDVVEDLERQRSLVAGRQHVTAEAREREGALAREAAVVPAPLEDVHAQAGGVGELQVEDLVPGDLPDRRRVAAPRQDVKGVEADAERRMIGGGDDPPRMLVLVDVAAPRERFVGDSQAAIGGPVGERAELLGREAVVVDRVGADARADEHRVGAERLHDVELGLGAAQVALEHRGGHGLEVAERLVERDAQPERHPRATGRRTGTAASRPGPVRTARSRRSRPRRRP